MYRKIAIFPPLTRESENMAIGYRWALLSGIMLSLKITFARRGFPWLDTKSSAALPLRVK